jgi:hypothetical protein
MTATELAWRACRTNDRLDVVLFGCEFVQNRAERDALESCRATIQTGWDRQQIIHEGKPQHND